MEELDANMPSLPVLLSLGCVLFWGIILLIGVAFSDKNKKDGKDTNN